MMNLYFKVSLIILVKKNAETEPANIAEIKVEEVAFPEF